MVDIPRGTIINAAEYTTEADARAQLADCDTNLPYLGTWTHPDLHVPVHLFATGVTAEQYQANGWTEVNA